ncbi:CCR4-NOT transcription complex subunit 3 [Hordeum vulgare]|nr:CCR4-NOT transcription complex subunit 3 [Hordeum vulgare]
MPAVASTPANLSTAVKDDESMSFPPRRPSPAVTEIGLGRGITRGLTSQALAAPISVGPVPGNGSITAIAAINDLSKRNISNTDERVNSGGLSQQLVSPLGSKIQQQPVLKTNDAVSSDSSNTSESAVLGGKGQFHGRPEILNDSFLELPSNMVSVVSWFFKYAWWFFIEDFSSLEQIKIVIVNLQTTENGWYAPTALHASDECTGMHTKLATFFCL